jgi:GNAT superfamily N-acetyltransferase
VDAATDADVRSFGPEGVEDVATVMAQVWPGEVAAFRERFTDEVEAAPERTRFYVAYVDGQPAAAAWAQASGPTTPFLGLWGGATVPAHRGRGLYRALVAARARDARAGGYRYATVDAGPMSEPILQRLGFVRLTTTTPCVFRPPRP